jgi:hypothetical protein
MTQALVMEVARMTPASRGRLERAEALWSEFGTYLEDER